MLRWILIALAALGLVGALVSLAKGFPGASVWSGWAAVCLIALVFERRRYKAILDAPPGDGWSATGEKFIDSRSGREVTVYFQASTGKRAYVGKAAG